MHQYAGIWRSSLDTNQAAVAMAPGGGVDARVTMLTLDHDGRDTTGINQQLGDFEVDLLLGKEIKPGVNLGLGYGFDNDTRQVGDFQVTVFF